MTKYGLTLGLALLAASVAACGGGSASSNGAAAPTVAVAASSGSSAPASGTPGIRAGRGPGAAGTVQSISGSTVTLQSLQGGTLTVQLNSNTVIRKQVLKAITDLQPGNQIFAFGQDNGGTVQARQIQLLAPGTTVPTGRGGPNGGGGRPGGNNGSGGNATTGQNGATFVSGTIDSISGATISVKKSDGTTAKVALASRGRIVEQAAATTADIKSGEFLTASGQKQGNDLVASAVNLADQNPRANGTNGPSQ